MVVKKRLSCLPLGLQLQYEEPPQEHVGVEARISTLQAEAGR